MNNLRRSAAVVAAAGIISAIGIGGVMSAQASSPDHSGSDTSQTERSDVETNDDATDTGPDANPNEPGHQDASDAGDGDGETAD